MTYIHSTLFIMHIVFGSLALILFWVPMLTKKGQLNHKRFGMFYKNTMYMVAATGAVMALMVISMPLVIKYEYAHHENAAQIASNLQIFWAFLLYLALLSFTVTRHGYAVLQAKDDRAQLRTVSHVVPFVLLFIGGVALGISGVARNHTLHIAFSILGMLLAVGSLRYIFAKHLPAKRYLLEHIGNMIGSGIGAYTAFVAFGGRTLLENAGSFQLVFWIAPGVIGGIASHILCKKYAKVFSIERSNGSTSNTIVN